MKRILKMLLELVLLTFIVITITFWLMHLIPGKEGVLQNPALTKESRDAIIHKYHLYDPLTTQYFIYLKHLITFDFGVSLVVHPDFAITSFIGPKIVLSLEISFIAIALSTVVGVVVGVLISYRPNSVGDRIGIIVVSLGMALPAFIIAILLGLLGPKIGLPVMFQKEHFATWILPIIATAIPTSFSKMKYVRDSMSENSDKQFAKFARVKGASRMRILFVHLLKPSLISTIIFLPIAITTSLVSGVFVENIFGIPGMGSMLGTAIQSKDYDLVQFLVMLTSVLTIVGFFLSDLLVTVIDPRMRGGR